MKKSYFRRRNEWLSPLARIALMAMGILLAVVLMLRFIWPSAFFTLLTPVFYVSTGLNQGAAWVFSGFNNASALTERVDELTRENDALTAENRALAARLEDIQRATGNEKRGDEVLAGVLARPPMAPYDTLIVELPPRVTVAEGALVLAGGGVPLGTIASVAGSVSHVALYSSPGRMTDAWVGEKRLPVTLYGQGGGAFITDIARDAEVTVGDEVYVSGPGALPIGTIRSIDSDSSLPRATLRIQPMLNMFSIPWVTVRIKS